MSNCKHRWSKRPRWYYTDGTVLKVVKCVQCGRLKEYE